MASSSADDDLVASKTEGFKVGEKKTVEEYAKLDQNDESLNRWKASLGISDSARLAVDPSDQRRCVIQSLALEVEGRPDMVVDLNTPGSVEKLKTKPFTIKEGAKFRMKATFRVQHDVLSGLKYLQVVKRKGIRVGKDEEMIGSYPPNTEDKPAYEKKFAQEEAPSGMMARGHYEAVSKFVDDDDHTHLKFEWSFDITKEWK
ncbi:MAG: rho-gdp dissociation inhibitor [Lasallia pustulata]|uniref:Rho GDP-dissociation inhibitor n=1 Tax=Lasallia pustulata TaxID=136370 RepID=A0A1W5D8J1_9LECA|nr:MAG: rho-gdp dissociation inhibitor [Lasallia pustulata]SLM39457.1 rho-gdp dissociation inhibitor [Lasallia pustulata]